MRLTKESKNESCLNKPVIKKCKVVKAKKVQIGCNILVIDKPTQHADDEKKYI